MPTQPPSLLLLHDPSHSLPRCCTPLQCTCASHVPCSDEVFCLPDGYEATATTEISFIVMQCAPSAC